MGNSGAKARSDHSAPPPAPRAAHLLPWLLLALLAHGLLLMPLTLPLRSESAFASPLQWRLVPQPPAAAGTESLPEAEKAPSNAQAPAARTNRTTPAQPLAASSAPKESTPRPSTAQAALAQPLPAGQWQYRLRWQGQEGVARLLWEQDGSRYRLSLTRQTDTKRLPDWESEGALTAAGLQPLTFSTRRGARVQTQLSYDPGAGTLTAQRQPSTPAPALTQDRLSWMLHAAAMAQAATLRPGGELQFWVAGWRVDLQLWRLRAEADAEHPTWLRLRRMPPEGSLVEQSLWLDPARGYQPVRLQVRWDDAERWEIYWDDKPVR